MVFQNSGIFIINKPFQWTSNDVIRKIKSNCKFKKIGHAGTLDPLATGILPILVNDSTKYFDYFQTFKKSYLAEIKFGFLPPLMIWKVTLMQKQIIYLKI